MPRLAAEVVTTTEVTLKPSLLKQLKLKLDLLRQLKAQAKGLKTQIDATNTDIENAFLKSDEYDALVAGVRIQTPFGEVPVKLITGKTGKRLNMKTLMNTVYVKEGGKFVKASPASLECCYDPPKDKKPYLGVFLPSEDDEDTDEE